jgi:protein-tyrosine-phosphatase
MAEALLKRIDAEHFEAQSAGISSGRPHPAGIQVMKEMGVDLAEKPARQAPVAPQLEFDYIITLDDASALSCRNDAHSEIVHWKIDDPVARSKNNPDVQLREFRMVRDQIAQRLRLFVIVNVRPERRPVTTAAAMASSAR